MTHLISNVYITTMKVLDFTQMNLSKFHCLNEDEHPQEFIEIMCVTPIKSANLVTYQLKGVAYISYRQWKKEMTVDSGHLN